jgi:hypothetical protein
LLNVKSCVFDDYVKTSMLVLQNFKWDRMLDMSIPYYTSTMNIHRKTGLFIVADVSRKENEFKKKSKTL